ncbi:hypothetical protein LTR56_001528 [Elasticomyces elasticus]|nr:hypothetical protein LTR56_001528 [Elasticomyces elasticus]KAK3668550.1 hypothetical protein LTR22_000437 [Elasticomyces elasticus]KAK5768567.1 hypothetical protein LTS12_001355 [Elasticomyces elasticus]
MASTYPPVYHHRSWATEDLQMDPYWTGSDDFRSSRSWFPSSVNLPPQPMHRFLQGHDRPYYPSHVFEQDRALQSLPNVPSQPHAYYGGNTTGLGGQRYASPSSTGISKSLAGSSDDDDDRSPWSSPNIRPATYRPNAGYIDESLAFAGHCGSYGDPAGHVSTHCVALHDVQQYADAQPEPVIYDDDHMVYGLHAHEGYHPVPEDVEIVVPCVPSQSNETDRGDDVSSGDSGPVRPRRRAQSTRSSGSSHSPSKIQKRPVLGKRTPSSASRESDNNDVEQVRTFARAFPCPFMPYGCLSTFGSKNEWKRHVHTQHMRLGYWSCDQCPDRERKPNNFNRKDLYIQHVRRMHPISAEARRASRTRHARARGHQDDGEDGILAEMQQRCYHAIRSPPAQSGCMFCEKTFDNWDERMEHIGKHMENAKKEGNGISATWQVDEATEEWLLVHGLATRQRNGLKLVTQNR